MENPTKTNPLAVTSFVYGLVLVGLWVLKPVFSLPFGVMAVLTIIGPLIGIVALLQMKRRNEIGQGQVIAWLGIFFAILSPLCQLLFLMTVSWSGY